MTWFIKKINRKWVNAKYVVCACTAGTEEGHTNQITSMAMGDVVIHSTNVIAHA
jgi:hypothetical protein